MGKFGKIPKITKDTNGEKDGFSKMDKFNDFLDNFKKEKDSIGLDNINYILGHIFEMDEDKPFQCIVEEVEYVLNKDLDGKEGKPSVGTYEEACLQILEAFTPEAKKELINSSIKDLLSETKEYFYEGYSDWKDHGDRFDNLNLDNKIKNHSLEDDDIIEVFNIVLRKYDNNLEADQGYYNSLKDLSSENTNFISGDGAEKMNELFEDYSDEEGDSEIDAGEFLNNIEYKTGYYFGLKSELEKI